MFLSQDYNVNSFKVKLNDRAFNLSQDVSAYREYAAQQRELDSNAKATRQYRSFAIIPDIVAIDILTKYGIDVHAPEFMQDKAQYEKFKRIIISEYPMLLTANIKKV